MPLVKTALSSVGPKILAAGAVLCLVGCSAATPEKKELTYTDADWTSGYQQAHVELHCEIEEFRDLAWKGEVDDKAMDKQQFPALTDRKLRQDLTMIVDVSRIKAQDVPAWKNDLAAYVANSGVQGFPDKAREATCVQSWKPSTLISVYGTYRGDAAAPTYSTGG